MALGPAAVSAPEVKGIYLYTPWNPQFVEALKALVPSNLRNWQGDRGSWYVFESFAEAAVKLAKSFYPSIDLSLYKAPGQSSSHQGQKRQEGWELNATRTKRRWIDADGFATPWYDIPGQQSQHRTWANGQSQGYGQTGSRPYDTQGSSPDHATLFVMPNAPPEVIRAAYKALAIMYHPDKGGKVETMQTLNQAMDRLKKAGKA